MGDGLAHAQILPATLAISPVPMRPYAAETPSLLYRARQPFFRSWCQSLVLHRKECVSSLEDAVIARNCLHMFNFIHPQAVVNRRPVAEMIVRQKARASINADTVLIAKPSRHRHDEEPSGCEGTKPFGLAATAIAPNVKLAIACTGDRLPTRR